MNLEQRVQALEQELAILKNQIQATLLDIREQVLNNSYPALRAESPLAEPDAQTVPAHAHQLPATAPMPSPQEAPASSAGPQVIKSNPRDRVEPRRETDEMVAPHSRRVVTAGSMFVDEYEDGSEQEPFGAAAQQPAARETTHYSSATPAPVRPAPRREMLASEPRNRPANDAQADDDTLVYPPVRRVSLDDIRQPLLDEDAFVNPSDIATPFITHDDEPPPFVTQTELITEADWAVLGQLETWVNYRVREYGASYTREMIAVYEAQGRFDSKVKKVLLQLVSIIAAEGRETSPSKAAVGPIRSEAAASRKDDGNQPSPRLILKLIAGVQNAGVGTSRRNDHG
jgi:hypothetical protein